MATRKESAERAGAQRDFLVAAVERDFSPLPKTFVRASQHRAILSELGFMFDSRGFAVDYRDIDPVSFTSLDGVFYFAPTELREQVVGAALRASLLVDPDEANVLPYVITLPLHRSKNGELKAPFLEEFSTAQIRTYLEVVRFLSATYPAVYSGENAELAVSTLESLLGK